MKVLLAAPWAAFLLTVLTACSPKGEEKSSTVSTQASSIQVSKAVEPKAAKAALFQASDEILLEKVDSSDYPILKDIFEGLSGQKSDCPDTSDTSRCSQYVMNYWDNELKAEPSRENLDLAFRKSYLDSLQNQAPHVQKEITKKAFAARYTQIKELVAAKSVCFFYAPWEIQFLDNKYHLAGGNGIHTAVRTNLRSSVGQPAYLFGGDDVYIVSQDGKFFAPVPAQIFGDVNYKKIAAYAEKTVGGRPVLKFCGKPTVNYNNHISALKEANKPVVKFDPLAPPSAPPELVAPQVPTALFRISKPIEWVQPPSMEKFDVIPMEWFASAL